MRLSIALFIVLAFIGRSFGSGDGDTVPDVWVESVITDDATRVDPDVEKRYNDVILFQNEPNPSNIYTVIPFHLKKSGRVTLQLYDALGNRIGTLVDMHFMASRYRVRFSVRMLPKGEYFYRLQTAEFSISKKMTVIN